MPVLLKNNSSMLSSPFCKGGYRGIFGASASGGRPFTYLKIDFLPFARRQAHHERDYLVFIGVPPSFLAIFYCD